MVASPKLLKTSPVSLAPFAKALQSIVQKANILFADKLTNNLWNGLEIDQYIRYLQIQYHLTKGVQNTFLAMAAHEDTRPYKKLRPFLVNFGYEEEMHYKLAEKDLKELGSDTGSMPFVVELWWAYQKSILPVKPMERLGATAILENIGNYAKYLEAIKKSAFGILCWWWFDRIAEFQRKIDQTFFTP